MSEPYRRPIVLFDLDGTLADIQHRRHLVEGDKTNAKWREFYARCVDDTLNHAVYAVWFLHHKGGYETWIVSGRSDEVRAETEEWLRLHHVAYDHLLMRPAKDHRPAVDLKREWLQNGTIPKKRVVCVFDDRSSVVAMWREEGLPCFQVAPGDF